MSVQGSRDEDLLVRPLGSSSRDGAQIMAELTIPRAHSNDWYDQLAGVQPGYYYPWKSVVGGRNGEDAFIDLVRSHLRPDACVLEVGCGHGDLALELAPHCQQIIAYDRVPAYIEIAQGNMARKNIRNIEFICFDTGAADAVNLPVLDQSVDMIVGRRAPLHWIEDARRVCRPGAVLLQLCPMEEPIPAWSSKLPHKLHYENSGRHTGHGSIHQSVENRLHQAGLTLHSGWSFDVPEIFSDQQEFYRMLTWGLPASEVSSFEDLAPRIEHIYARYGDADGMTLRHCRFLWQAFIKE
jgi:SAM-dependent methyltransferase